VTFLVKKANEWKGGISAPCRFTHPFKLTMSVYMNIHFTGEKNPPLYFIGRWNWVSVMTQWYFRNSIFLLSPYHVSSICLNKFYLHLLKIIIDFTRLMKKEKDEYKKK
tara:strand:- start:465 stop:788 length:324 start_codon:yes stop_codon:yes gene_type:complete